MLPLEGLGDGLVGDLAGRPQGNQPGGSQELGGSRGEASQDSEAGEELKSWY